MTAEWTKGTHLLLGGYVLRVDPFTTNRVDTMFGDENVDGAFIWFDRSLRLWTTYLLDGSYQVGSASYANTRDEIEDEVRFQIADARAHAVESTR